ncbi:MAG: Hsp20/alpha crystallin family protein [Gammaproteobacteria bacterium]|nr:MAG: Hsp20/alpha crystallin family protein [Gammaproteobacteria bacterium]
MSLSVWDPFQEMETLLDHYNRSSRKTLANSGDRSFEVGDWMPVVDIEETEDAFSIKAELPGVEKDDVSINIDKGVLTIKGEKKTETEDKKRHRVECSYGSFVRSFTLPQSIKVDKVEAQYNNGILNLTIPKSEEAKPKEVEVKIK